LKGFDRMADDEHELVSLASLARRLEAISHLAERQREVISEIVNEAVALDMRVRSLENLAQTRAITEAREDERDKALYDRLSRIEDQIKDIRGFGSKALWIIGGVLLTAVATFIIQGGLATH
jgi:hypothetical protein